MNHENPVFLTFGGHRDKIPLLYDQLKKLKMLKVKIKQETEI